MTNKERLISLVGFAPDTNALDGALLDAGITSGDTYDGSNSADLKKCAIDIMEILLTTPDTSQSDAGVTTNSIRYDRNAILKRIEKLKGELGIADLTQPNITSARVW